MVYFLAFENSSAEAWVSRIGQWFVRAGVREMLILGGLIEFSVC